MKLAFWSDAHAGNGSHADNLGASGYNELVVEMSHMKELGYANITVGDMAELLQFTAHEILKRHPNIKTEIFTMQGVCGNHSMKWDKEKGYKDTLIIPWGENRILVRHGHQDDRSASWIGKLAYKVLGNKANNMLTRFGLRVYRVVENICGGIKQNEPISPSDPRYIGNTKEYVDGAIKAAKENECNFVVFGHTHVPGIWERDGVVAMNCGTFIEGKKMHVWINDECPTTNYKAYGLNINGEII